MAEPENNFRFELTEEMNGERLDKALSKLMPEFTRSTIQQWIKQERILINGIPEKQKFKLSGNEVLEIHAPAAETLEHLPENIEINIIDEDAHIIVIDKPVGLVVHPGAGNPKGTLLNGLLGYNEALSKLPRAGIVHRLDKDTSGLMVIAKTEQSRQKLIAQLDSRSMHRQYLAIVNGIMISGETIDQPIGRHRQDRLRMTVTQTGKSAITHLRVLKKFRYHSLIQANLESGRTHQIRVHLSWRGYPIVGDKQYGFRTKFPPKASEEFKECLQNFHRQALHAEQLTLIHPDSDSKVSWKSPMPEDMQILINHLDHDLDIQAPR